MDNLKETIEWAMVDYLAGDSRRIGHARHHTPGKITTLNFKILYDADWLVNLADEFDTGDKIKLEDIIEKVFLTSSGKALAKRRYLISQFPIL